MQFFSYDSRVSGRAAKGRRILLAPAFDRLCSKPGILASDSVAGGQALMANIASWPLPFGSSAATSWWQSAAEPIGAAGNGARVTAAVDDLSLLEQVAQGDVQAYRQ